LYWAFDWLRTRNRIGAGILLRYYERYKPSNKGVKKIREIVENV
jgi:hypothetical protein